MSYPPTRSPRYFEQLDPVTLRRIDRALLELRERGLSHTALATVLDLYEGLPVTADQVRTRLGKLGAPKNPNKARPSRRAA